MNLSILKILRCPFCGGYLNVEQNVAASGPEMRWGILWCECSAFPVVDGIPYLRVGAVAKDVMKSLDCGKPEESLSIVCGRPVTDVKSFQEGLRVFAPGPEGDYFVHRFSDPTFVVSDSLLLTIGAAVLGQRGRALDACGGTGHLARTMLGLGAGEVWLTDLEYWKLWLARRFIAPQAHVICCDANQPLPFAPKSFALAFCSDAINYVWQRRLFAQEMMRMTSPGGLTLFTHVHNALCDNPSPGMPLSPDGLQHMLEGFAPTFFSESALLESMICKDVAALEQDHDVSSAAAMEIIITSRRDLLRSYAVPQPAVALGEWRVNPLYRNTQSGETCTLAIEWPHEFYETEFRDAKAYLPEQVTIARRKLDA